MSRVPRTAALGTFGPTALVCGFFKLAPSTPCSPSGLEVFVQYTAGSTS